MEERIKRYFYDRPRAELNLRTLAREIGTSHMSAVRHAKALAEKGHLNLQRKKLETVVSLNKQNTKDERRLHNIKKVLDSGLVEHLEEVYEHPKAIIPFGSYSFGEDDGLGDIDIAVQTSMERQPDRTTYEKKLERPLEIFTLNEKTSKELRTSIYNGIVLRGRIR